MAVSNKMSKKVSSKRIIHETEFSTQLKRGKSLREAKLFAKSKIRAIGNSKGVILNNQIMEAAGIDPESEIIISADIGVITIYQAATSVNTDLLSWEKQFKKVAKKGIKPEKDLFEGIENEFDSNEW
ncbi:MAG: hypothetical protein H0V30_08960 [Chitinophagaceae bacterium]|jgi:antitoxin component of MazEF toxin-antitoxin module|nr:hypothetical protein [Chitinophagaceae bacterium]